MAALDASATAHSPALRTLLLLDLCDSTQLVERMGDQRAAELFRRHDRLVRSLLAEQHGREIDKTDGFLLLFERPVQAIGFALQYQRRLREFAQDTGAAMAARIGIHVGDVMVWDNSAEDIAQGAKPVEVEGLAKPVAARMMGLALPGQILLSKVAADLARRGMSELGELAARAQLIDHGLYRFKGVDEAQAVIEVGEAGVAPLQAPPGGGKAQRARPWWRTPIALTAEAVIAIALLVGVGWVVLKPESGIAFEARDWVVVADVQNVTGNDDLTASMDVAFRQGLAQSQFVNLVSAEQRRSALQRMRLDPDKVAVGRDVAVELAQREQVRAVLLPTLSRSPNGLRFALEVIDPQTGVSVWTTQQEAQDESGLLPAIDEILADLRQKLGESLKDIEISKPLAQVTTSDMEALRTYSIGRQRFEQLRYGEASQLFKRARELDPEFAMAYLSEGIVYAVTGRREEAGQLFNSAKQHADRLSSREELYVDAMLAFTDRPAESVEKWRLFANLYPGQYSGQNNAGLLLWQVQNDCQQAERFFGEVIAGRHPMREYTIAFDAHCKLWLGQHEAALTGFRSLQGAAGSITYGVIDALSVLGEQAEIDRRLAEPVQDVASLFQLERLARGATALADRGDVAGARALLMKLERDANSHQLKGSAARARLGLAALEVYLGEPSKARQLLQQAAEAELALIGAVANQHDPERHLLLLSLLADQLDPSWRTEQWLRAAEAALVGRDVFDLQQLLSLVQILHRYRSGTPESLNELNQLITGRELVAVHVLRMRLGLASNRTDLAQDSARWLVEHHGRMYGEYNGLFAAQIPNVLERKRAIALLAPSPGAANRD